MFNQAAARAVMPQTRENIDLITQTGVLRARHDALSAFEDALADGPEQRGGPHPPNTIDRLSELWLHDAGQCPSSQFTD